MKQYEKPVCEDIELRVEENVAHLVCPYYMNSGSDSGCPYVSSLS